jgi:DNA-binding NarL/FixJ family response regulator
MSPVTSEGGRARVAVVDPLPVFAQGLVAMLRAAGFEAEAPDDVPAWSRHPGPNVVLLTALRPEDWTTAIDLVSAGTPPTLVLLLDDPDPAGYSRAVSVGATGAVPREAQPAVLIEVLRAALDGFSLMPAGMLREIVVRRPALPEHEVTWLRQLAGGTTVARLAEQAGYSERMMFRLLSDMYARLGVTGRTGALIYARDHGWL